MSTKNTTTGSNQTAFQFNPGSMSAYTSNLASFLPFAQGLYQNPYGNQMFQQESAINQDQAANIGARNKSNVLANANAMGYSTNGGLINSMLASAGRATGNLQAQGFRSAVQNANSRAMTGLGISSAFQPLMTGSNSNFQQTQQTSGLGTWLPQVAGMALGAATNAFMPGAGAASSAIPGVGSASDGAPTFNGVIGGGPGLNTGLTGLPNFFGNSSAPSFFGNGYGYQNFNGIG